MEESPKVNLPGRFKGCGCLVFVTFLIFGFLFPPFWLVSIMGLCMAIYGFVVTPDIGRRSISFWIIAVIVTIIALALMEGIFRRKEIPTAAPTLINKAQASPPSPAADIEEDKEKAEVYRQLQDATKSLDKPRVRELVERAVQLGMDKELQEFKQAGWDKWLKSPDRVKIGQQIRVGQFMYYVNGVEYVDSFPHYEPDSGSYLVIRLTVTNISNESRVIPTMNLIDSQGREFDSETMLGVKDDIGFFEKINPGIAKKGRLIYDAPAGNYMLRLDGGMLDTSKAYVELY